MRLKLNENWKQDNGKYKCPHCNKEYTMNGICSHIICSHMEEGRNRIKNHLIIARKNIKNTNKNRVCVHKDNIIKYIDKNELLNYENNGWKRGNIKTLGLVAPNKGIKLSEEQCNKISKYMKEVAKRRPHNWKIGRGKSGIYKGFWCDSSWELAYVIYCLDNNINIIRNNNGFTYIWQNEEHTYYPDFYNNDTKEYIEIKGFENNKDKEKIKQFKDNIKVYYYKDMKPIFEYVKNNYGEDFISLYE